MSFDSAASKWCKSSKNHLLSNLSFDSLNSLFKVVQSLSDRREHLEYPPNFAWRDGSLCSCPYQLLWAACDKSHRSERVSRNVSNK